MAKTRLIRRELTPEFRKLVKRIGRTISRHALDPALVRRNFEKYVKEGPPPHGVVSMMQVLIMTLLESREYAEALALIDASRDLLIQHKDSIPGHDLDRITLKRLRAQAWMARGALPLPEDLAQREAFHTPEVSYPDDYPLLLLQMCWLAHQGGAPAEALELGRRVWRQAWRMWCSADGADDPDEDGDDLYYIHVDLLKLFPSTPLARPAGAPIQ